MSTTKLKEQISAFLFEEKLKLFKKESAKGVKGGGVNVTIDHHNKLTTDQFKELVNTRFPKAKFRHGCWESWTNVTFYL